MRTFLLFILVLLFCSSCFAQDKQLLQKQLTEIMKDYTSKFRNLKAMQDTFYLAFDLSGTDKGSMILTFDNKTYISSFLPTPHSDTEAKTIFDKWVSLVSSITLNGAKLSSKNCSLGKYDVYCHQWQIDNSSNNIAAAYLPFTIEVTILKLKDAFAASLKIGDL